MTLDVTGQEKPDLEGPRSADEGPRSTDEGPGPSIRDWVDR